MLVGPGKRRAPPARHETLARDLRLAGPGKRRAPPARGSGCTANHPQCPFLPAKPDNIHLYLLQDLQTSGIGKLLGDCSTIPSISIFLTCGFLYKQCCLLEGSQYSFPIPEVCFHAPYLDYRNREFAFIRYAKQVERPRCLTASCTKATNIWYAKQVERPCCLTARNSKPT